LAVWGREGFTVTLDDIMSDHSSPACQYAPSNTSCELVFVKELYERLKAMESFLQRKIRFKPVIGELQVYDNHGVII
jgi:hypothetical protein